MYSGPANISRLTAAENTATERKLRFTSETTAAKALLAALLTFTSKIPLGWTVRSKAAEISAFTFQASWAAFRLKVPSVTWYRRRKLKFSNTARGRDT